MLFLFLVGLIVLGLLKKFQPATPAKEDFKTGNKVEAMMMRNMIKADQEQRDQLSPEDFLKLPKPDEVIKIAKGPLQAKETIVHETVLEKLTTKLKKQACSNGKTSNHDLLAITGHPGSGLSEFLSWFHLKFGYFVLHQSEIRSAKDVMYALTNLSNCAIVNPVDFDSETNEEASAFQFNAMILEGDKVCDDKCLTSPKLWEQMCQYFNGQVLSWSLDNEPPELIKQLSKEEALKVIFLYRDPRACLDPISKTLEQDAVALCESLNLNLREIDHANTNQVPKKTYFMVRFEDFILKPEHEVVPTEFVKHSPSFCSKAPEEAGQRPSRDQVDGWKLKFSMSQLVMIEDKCAQVLNRLEYPIYGSNEIS